MELITKLGIDWRLLLAQLLNFSILMLVLNYFLYKPILGILREREIKVKKSLEDSQKIEEELLATAKEKDKTIREANQQAQVILSEAKNRAELEKQDIVKKAQSEAEQIIIQSQEQTVRMAKQTRQAIKEELADLVIDATSQVIAKKLDKKSDAKLIDDALKSIAN
jgi:F-type H+-transporting ATPase subunit b